MARVIVTCQSYNGAYHHLNRSHQIDITRWQFLVATLTVGFQRFGNVVQAGHRLWLHRLGQGLSAMSYLTDDFGNLRLSADHQSLDGSEKGGMSYWQGMVFAKLAASEILGIPWLQHADAMEKAGRLQRIQLAQPGNTKQNKRADMVGRDMHLRWHVIEAKGFSRNLPPNAIQNAKAQAAVVGLIDNIAPETTSASVTCLWKSPIEIILDDPPPSGNEEWVINDYDYWQSYYGALAEYILKSPPVFDPNFPGFIFASLPDFPSMSINSIRQNEDKTLKIGLPQMLLKDLYLYPESIPDLIKSLDRREKQIAKDGVALLGHAGDFGEVI